MTAEVVALTTKDRQDLVVGVSRLIERKVRDLAPWAHGEEREDIVGAARVGASLAASRFSTSHGTRFTSYATPYICGAIVDHIRAESRQRGILFRAASLSGREFMAEQSDTFKVLWDDAATNRGRLETLAERLLAAMFAGVAGGALASPEEVVANEGDAERAVKIVREAVAQDPEIERRIYAMRYVERQTLVAIAKALAVDESTVRRHHEALLDRIAALLHAAGITEEPETF